MKQADSSVASLLLPRNIPLQQIADAWGMDVPTLLQAAEERQLPGDITFVRHAETWGNRLSRQTGEPLARLAPTPLPWLQHLPDAQGEKHWHIAVDARQQPLYVDACSHWAMDAHRYLAEALPDWTERHEGRCFRMTREGMQAAMHLAADWWQGWQQRQGETSPSIQTSALLRAQWTARMWVQNRHMQPQMIPHVEERHFGLHLSRQPLHQLPELAVKHGFQVRQLHRIPFIWPPHTQHEHVFEKWLQGEAFSQLPARVLRWLPTLRNGIVILHGDLWQGGLLPVLWNKPAGIWLRSRHFHPRNLCHVRLDMNHWILARAAAESGQPDALRTMRQDWQAQTARANRWSSVMHRQEVQQARLQQGLQQAREVRIRQPEPICWMPLSDA